MRLHYICSECGADITQLEVQKLDEHALGIDQLTVEERQQLLSFDAVTDTLEIKAICDDCINEIYEPAPVGMAKINNWIH